MVWLTFPGCRSCYCVIIVSSLQSTLQTASRARSRLQGDKPQTQTADSSQGKEQAAEGQTTYTDRVISRQDRKQGLGRVS